MASLINQIFPSSDASSSAVFVGSVDLGVVSNVIFGSLIGSSSSFIFSPQDEVA